MKTELDWISPDDSAMAKHRPEIAVASRVIGRPDGEVPRLHDDFEQIPDPTTSVTSTMWTGPYKMSRQSSGFGLRVGCDVEAGLITA